MNPPLEAPQNAGRALVTFGLTIVGLRQELFYLIGWNCEGDARCHLQGVNPNHLTILKSKGHGSLTPGGSEAGTGWKGAGKSTGQEVFEMHCQVWRLTPASPAAEIGSL